MSILRRHRAVQTWTVLGILGILCLVPAQSSEGNKYGSGSGYVHRIGLYTQDANGLRGHKITPDPTTHTPFSMTQSCNWCHDVNTIAQGMHFTLMTQQSASARQGEPWIVVDAAMGVQIPVSYQGGAQTLQPEKIGLDEKAMIQRFGHHLPGGEPLEINCLACHGQDPRVDLGGPGAYGDRLRRGQTSWAVTAGSGVATVSGGWDSTSPKAHYPASLFDDHNDVFVGLTKDIPDTRCVYCHDTVLINDASSLHMSHDPDVHQLAGLSCVDCHQAGLDHKMATGVVTSDVNALDQATLTCQGCHLGDGSLDRATAGRLGAPVPEHKGIPLVHFEKLACVTCHSGPWPQATVGQVKTARAHQLGTTFARAQDEAVPHVYYPVYVKGNDGKIQPCKLIWPAYWGFLANEQVTPMALDRVRIITRQVIRPRDTSENGTWPKLTDVQVIEILKGLAALKDTPPGEPVYVCGGKIHSIDAQGQLVASDHACAEPCVWPAGHAVRPAAQALGVRACQDCHQEDSALFFGQVPVDSPMVSDADRTVSMVTFLKLDPEWARRFGRSFQYRIWLKRLLTAAVGILCVIVVCFAFRAVNSMTKALGRRE